MNLCFVDYNLNIPFIANEISVLYIENEKAYRSFVSELWKTCQGQSDGVHIYDKDKSINPSKKMEVILNPVDLSINDKKVLSKLYSEMNSITTDFLYQDMLELNSQIQFFLEHIFENTVYSLSASHELNLDGLFKLYDVKLLENEEQSFLEYIIEYLRLRTQILSIQVFAFVGLKNYFTNEEMESLYEFVKLQKIHLLLIEGVQRIKLKSEKIYILDSDLCSLIIE